jgi:hypothetical protein
MEIVAFHAGKRSMESSFEAALACGLDMTVEELKNAHRSDFEGPDLSGLLFNKLNDLVTARGGHPIMENGSLVLERPEQDDARRTGFGVLDELYQELPEELKYSQYLIPPLSCYVRAMIAEHNRTKHRSPGFD